MITVAHQCRILIDRGRLYVTVDTSVSSLLILHTWFSMLEARRDCTEERPTTGGGRVYMCLCIHNSLIY